MDIKERFESFKDHCFFSRIDNSHILELYIGLDDKGRKAFELRYPFNYKKITGTSSIEINQFQKEKYNTIRFSLCNEEINGLFYKFCEDIVEQTKNLKDEAQGYNTIINRFFQWKKLFVSGKKKLLTEPEIMGLIGEILFLRGNLAERIGISNALRSWSGYELTKKDFSFEDIWFESKTISRGIQNIKISSIEQLDSENAGEIVLHILEKMSPAYNGIKLNDLILETRNMFSSSEEQEKFMSAVALQGYEYNNYYDDFIYEISSFTRYRVDKDFPKLTRQSLPKAIYKATYEISLSEIAEFEIKE